MDTTPVQLDFAHQLGLPLGATVVNGRVWFQDLHGMRAVFVNQTPFYTFDLRDEVENRFCAVQLVEAQLACVQEVCRAFQIGSRTFSRIRREVREGGIAALVKRKGGPNGRRKLTRRLTPVIVCLYQEERKSVPDIASQLGLSPRTVGRVLKDAGIPRRGNRQVGQTELFCVAPLDQEPPLRTEEGPSEPHASAASGCHNEPASEVAERGSDRLDQRFVQEAQETIGEQAVSEAGEVALEMSAAAPPAAEAVGVLTALGEDEAAESEATESNAEVSGATLQQIEATSIPYASPLERFLTLLGMIEEAPVRFESANGVAGAGSLLGLALLSEMQLVQQARAVYGSLNNGWYGLRCLLWQLLVMAWLRIKRPEQIKLHDPTTVGRLLGLPRAAEVKTIRRKLREVAGYGKAAEFHRRLAKIRASADAELLATLYVDGHVRVYHGKHRISKTYVSRSKSVMRGETDYWVHMAHGQPLLVIHDAANEGFTKVMREEILPEIRRVIGERRARVVFDRAGWSRELFWALLEAEFDFTTYRRGPYEPLPEDRFATYEIECGGRRVSYELAEDVFEAEGWPRLRLIAVKRKNGEQTHIVSSGQATWESLKQVVENYVELPAGEVAWWMFGRWCQENWFKYMDAEYALDLLVDYQVEADDAARQVPNPAWRKLDRQVTAARRSLQREEAKYAEWVRESHSAKQESKGCNCGKCVHCRLQKQESVVAKLREEFEQLRSERGKTPKKIALADVPDRDPVRLSYERKLFTDTVKLCAYEIETRLVEMVRGVFTREAFEGRSLVRDIFQATGDLVAKNGALEVHLEQLSTPRYTEAMMSLCQQINALKPTLVETDLRLCFFVKPRPTGE